MFDESNETPECSTQSSAPSDLWEYILGVNKVGEFIMFRKHESLPDSV